MSSAVPVITVIGSINMDVVIRCESLPVPGQTILAKSSVEVCGGKGANQAVAAARAGGRVSMVGKVGSDTFADRLIDNLVDNQIDCSFTTRERGASGIAVIAVEDSGQNSIMVVPGANALVSPSDVQAAKESILRSDVVLLQLEVPIETVAEAIRIAKTGDVPVILDPAPAVTELPDKLLTVDLLCPNESEASAIFGQQVRTIEDATLAAKKFHELGASNVAITMGDQGTVLYDGNQTKHVSAFACDAIDTTAAGDAFAGAFAVRWSETGCLETACRFANAAGALAASREGAQPSMATRAEIHSLWSSHL